MSKREFYIGMYEDLHIYDLAHLYDSQPIIGIWRGGRKMPHGEYADIVQVAELYVGSQFNASMGFSEFARKVLSGSSTDS